MSNYLECAQGIVHADSGDGQDHTLCGLTAERILDSEADYAPEEDSELVPALVETNKKITCPKCAAIIRWCCHLGTKSIGKVKD